MFIDKYVIKSFSNEWKNGKQTKKEVLNHHLKSDEMIKGKLLIQLIDDLNEAWHRYDNKQISIEVTFKDGS
jgi:hypothetical protein